jgi:hypothetical protein
VINLKTAKALNYLKWPSETRIAPKVPTILRLRLDAVAIRQPRWGGPMHVRSSGFLNPMTLATLETAFDEAWETLNGNGDKISPGELARCMLRLAMEGERDLASLRDWALSNLNSSIAWREAS